MNRLNIPVLRTDGTFIFVSPLPLFLFHFYQRGGGHIASPAGDEDGGGGGHKQGPWTDPLLGLRPDRAQHGTLYLLNETCDIVR